MNASVQIRKPEVYVCYLPTASAGCQLFFILGGLQKNDLIS
ncbi:hypothetical protein C900_02889 [Fulvivirga imtechensis AK7]|uniref:Uncharacterized protein n=1 Tax=Fulvivirga imtechensis AK7 TaxID=1237149 RepID=L8JUQ1_9BACT|nr:hypothetical protein C900_02889 [Fulvivirga imtechensis AK7]